MEKLPAKWVRPKRGTIKVNTDASTQDDRMVGFGMVARDKDGEIMDAASLYPTLVFSHVIA